MIEPTPFSWHSSNGILKSRLFRGWPKDRLAQIVYSNTQPSFDVCEHHWRLSKLGIVKGLLGRSSPSIIEGIPPSPGALTAPASVFEYDSRARIERMLSGLDERVRVPIGEAVFRLPCVVSNPLRRWIEAFNPDVIFSSAGTAAMLRTAVKIARWRNISIVPYFTDDWITTQYEDVLLQAWLRRSLSFWFRDFLALSAVRFTTCDQMTLEYRRRYGGDFETLLFPEPRRDAPRRTLEDETTGTVRLLFIGSLVPDRWRSLRAIGEALRDLRNEGIRGELLIYTYPSDVTKFGADLTLEPVMRMAGPAPPDAVPGLQGQADVLVHVESFDTVFRRWTRFSLSTKIPQYLMAGRCIFAYGPAEAASMQYLGAAEAGVTVTDEGPAVLRAALRQLIGSAELRQQLAEQAGTVGAERHDDERQRKHFRAAMVRGCTRTH